jgi:hypothetical protein
MLLVHALDRAGVGGDITEIAAQNMSSGIELFLGYSLRADLIKSQWKFDQVGHRGIGDTKV